MPPPVTTATRPETELSFAGLVFEAMIWGGGGWADLEKWIGGMEGQEIVKAMYTQRIWVVAPHLQCV